MKCISENWFEAKVTSIPSNIYNFVLQTIGHHQNSHAAVLMNIGQPKPFMLLLSKKYDFQVLILLKLSGRKLKFFQINVLQM